MFKQIAFMIFAVVLSFSVMAQDQASGNVSPQYSTQDQDQRIAVGYPGAPSRLPKFSVTDRKLLYTTCRGVIGKICRPMRPVAVYPRPLYPSGGRKDGMLSYQDAECLARRVSQRVEGVSVSVSKGAPDVHQSCQARWSPTQEHMRCLDMAALLSTENGKYKWRSADNSKQNFVSN